MATETQPPPHTHTSHLSQVSSAQDCLWQTQTQHIQSERKKTNFAEQMTGKVWPTFGCSREAGVSAGGPVVWRMFAGDI